jgi:uncharacterized protein YecA (UPF0149 family)
MNSERVDERNCKTHKCDIGPKVLKVTSRNYIGRNQLCPCRSGKKYKKCCLLKREYTPDE